LQAISTIIVDKPVDKLLASDKSCRKSVVGSVLPNKSAPEFQALMCLWHCSSISMFTHFDCGLQAEKV
jgi:hypothetical protein